MKQEVMPPVDDQPSASSGTAARHPDDTGMDSLPQRLFDETARIEQILHFGSMFGDGESPSPPMEEFMDDSDWYEQCLPDLPKWVIKALDRGGQAARDAFSQWINDERKYGFALQFATPVMEHIKTGGETLTRSYSWGCYRAHWVYAGTFAAAVEKGFAWVAEWRAVESSRSRSDHPGAIPGTDANATQAE